MNLFILIIVSLSTINCSSFSGSSETKSANKDIIDERSPYFVNELESTKDLDNEGLNLLKDETQKRRLDRMMFHSSLGKRDAELDDDTDGLEKRGRIDTYGFTGMLGKRGGLDRYGFVGSLGKRRGLDRYSFVGSLGKRGGLDRFGFVGALGKRGGLDRFGFVGALGKRGYDRYGFVGNLGKRRGMDRYSFIGALGKRGYDRYGFVGNLGKRIPGEDNDESDLEKRAKLDRYSFFGNLGKRMEYPDDFAGQIEKRSVDTSDSATPVKRRKRAALYPWYLDRRQRYSPSRWLRGIDTFSFGTRLGKRAPNYRFYPQLGKRDDLTPYILDDLPIEDEFDL